jgi:integrase/recombinase XerD
MALTEGEGRLLEDGLADKIDLFLRYIANERRVAPNTVAAYHNDLQQFRDYLQSSAGAISYAAATGTGELGGLDAGAVAGFVLHLREKGYAQATVARKIAAVKSFFRYAAEAGFVPSNPAAALDSPRVHRAVPQAVSPSEVQALLETGCAGDMPDDLRNRAMLTLLYHSGMRVSELVALDLADVDLGGGVVLCRGRASRVRSIPLPEPALLALTDYLKAGRPALLRLNGQDEAALFLNHRGSRLTRQGFWLIMKDRAREAGIKVPMTPHTLRHSFAVHHLGSGVALRELKELLGHVNISTTQIYTLASRGERRTAGARGKRLGDDAPPPTMP